MRAQLHGHTVPLIVASDHIMTDTSDASNSGSIFRARSKRRLLTHSVPGKVVVDAMDRVLDYACMRCEGEQSRGQVNAEITDHWGTVD